MGKCKILYLGSSKAMHFMDFAQKDLSLQVGVKLKVSQQRDLAIREAKGVLGCTGQSSSRSKDLILPLCSAPETLCPVLDLLSTTVM